MPESCTTTSASDADDAWLFAQGFYARDGVAEACLRLQDEQGADVVLLIGLLWTAVRHGRAVDVAGVAQLDAALAAWRGMTVIPLRKLRQTLKLYLEELPAAAVDVRETVKRAELTAERVALELLINALAALPAPDAPAAPVMVAERSFAAYRNWLEPLEIKDFQVAAAVLLNACLDMSSETETDPESG